MDAKACRDRADLFGFEMDYGVFSGCSVKADGHWVSIDNYFANWEIR